MSKLGKLLLIFGIIAFISAIAFGISIAALGVSNGNYGIVLFGNRIPFLSLGATPQVVYTDNVTVYTFDYESGRTYEQSFEALSLNDINIETASAQTTITCSETDKVYVKYTAGSTKMRFTAEMKNGKFTATETGVFGIFSFGSTQPAQLEIKLPAKLYNDVHVAVASGRMSADGIIADKMKIELASGELDLKVFAKKIYYSAASGHGTVTNCTEDTADDIQIHTASGGQEFSGFTTRQTNVDIASGYVTMRGISGKVEADIASGRIELDYAEWNDRLEIDLMSGKADVKLPAGSGLDLDFDRASGGMDISLDNDVVSLNKDSGGSYGGSNRHDAEIDVASGHVSIHN